MGELGCLPVQHMPTYESTPFGKEMRKHFLFDSSHRNLNHGSFGATPRAIQEHANHLRYQAEARPDSFIRYEYPKLLDEARAAVAKLVNAPLSGVVFIPSATVGTNTVLRNIVWNPDGKDEILQFTSVYGGLGKTTEYLCESTQDLVSIRHIPLSYPFSDASILAAFQASISASRDAGKTPRIAVFDTINALPGVRVPYEELTSICRDSSILSLVDGAHGIGHIPLNLTVLDPDFFISNLHKWLFVPRGCAFLYVSERNQAMMRSSLPTSHGYIPRPGRVVAHNPLPPSTKSEFVNNFEFVGSLDSAPYLSTPEAVRWRQEVCGGEERIMEYCARLALQGGQKVAEILGTKVLDNVEGSMHRCCMSNVLLPLTIGIQNGDVTDQHAGAAAEWMQRTLIDDYNTFIVVWVFQGAFWARLSGQVYLDMEDFEWTGKTLQEVCERVGKGEFLNSGPAQDN